MKPAHCGALEVANKSIGAAKIPFPWRPLLGAGQSFVSLWPEMNKRLLVCTAPT